MAYGDSMKSLKSFSVLLAAIVTAGGVAAAQTPAPATLKLTPQTGWVSKPSSSAMRVAEFTLPKVGTDPENATVTLYYFGGQGGDVNANLDRWISQIVQPDGSPSKSVAKTSRFFPAATGSGLEIVMVDVSGTYVAEVTPGSPEKFNKPGFRQCAAYIQTKSGPYFAKLVGPAATVAKWYDSYVDYLKSAR